MKDQHKIILGCLNDFQYKYVKSVKIKVWIKSAITRYKNESPCMYNIYQKINLHNLDINMQNI